MKSIKNWVLLVLLVFIFAYCGGDKSSTSQKSHTDNKQGSKHKVDPKALTIISGSENKTLEPIIHEFSQKEGLPVQIKYKGSVDIMLELGEDNFQYDAVWPANSLWISMGDSKRRVKHVQSIMTSPVVFGIRKSLAQELGFVGKKVQVRDILSAILNKKLKFMMTSATQSNSGCSAYIGFLYALLGNPEILTQEDLKKPELKDQIRKLLGGIHRSSGSSGWLKDLFLQGNYDAMVNYEALIIEANQELVRKGKEPLYTVYPIDGLVIADSPLGFVNKGNNKDKESIFLKLQEYLLKDEVQAKLQKHGRRTGFGGLVGDVDKTVFNPDWGIDPNKIISPIKMPKASVLHSALNFYQTEFRKPSFTVYCLDFSGSMLSKGAKQLKEAMTTLLNQDIAKKYLIHASEEDITVVVPFNHAIIQEWRIEGNKPEVLNELLQKILNLRPDGGTDIYTPVIQSISDMNKIDLDNYIPAVILMTDGKSKYKYDDLVQFWTQSGNDIPVFSILFGQASRDQLNQIAELTRGRVFDGSKDLIKAFRKAKGYN